MEWYVTRGDNKKNSEDVLMHYGILGMKWGVRRYQNYDGSLTKAGKNRYKMGHESEPKNHDSEEASAKLSIWGRDFNLPIVYDLYPGEAVTESQKTAVKRLLDHKDWIETSKKHIEKYCEEEVSRDSENQKKDNIFSYVKPKSVYIPRDRDDSLAALMCNYRYDQEHGLAVVFSKDGKITVGIQDIIL